MSNAFDISNMSLKQILDKLVKSALEAAEDMLAKDDQDLPPVCIAANDKGEIEPMFIYSPSAEIAQMAMRQHLKNFDAIAYVFCSEGWAIEVPKTGQTAQEALESVQVSPSQHKDRIEILSVVGGAIDGQRTTVARKIVKLESGTRSLGDVIGQSDKAEDIVGPFASLLSERMDPNIYMGGPVKKDMNLWGLNWHPLGDAIRSTIPDFVKDKYDALGYNLYEASDPWSPGKVFVAVWGDRDQIPKYINYMSGSGLGLVLITTHIGDGAYEKQAGNFIGGHRHQMSEGRH